MDFQNGHEEFCFNTAIKFTAVRRTQGQAVNKEFPTIDEAKEFASTFNDGRTMIYAVNDLGNNAHITNA